MGDVVRHPRLSARWVRDPGPWVSKKQVAAELGVSTRTVDRWVEYGLPMDTATESGAWRYVGSRRRYKLTAVLRWLDAPAGALSRVS